MKRILMAICLMCLMMPVLPVSAETKSVNIYVSPDGTGNGMSKSSPIGGIEKAQRLVRSMAENMQSDITVNLLGGIYYLENPIKMNETDSGRNGYKIIWQSMPGEEAIISGGRELSGWEQHDGNIWKINVPKEFGDNFITNLYVNDKVGAFSRIEDKFFVGEIGDAVNLNGETVKTMTFNPEEVPIQGKMHDALLFWDYNWRHYMFPVERAYVNKDGKHVFETIPGSPAYIINTNYLPPSYNFIVANAYAFIDTPGEFYYDRENMVIYYMKDEAEDLASAKTIAPYLDHLLRIEGETSVNPAQNIEFKNITFAHSMCQRNYQHGLYANQGIEAMNPIFESIEDVEIMLSNRGAVEVLTAQNITFEGNKFEKMDNVGLSMYTSVYDSKVTGNLFQDIADTAISVGVSPEDKGEKEKLYGLTEISARKPVSMSNNEVRTWYDGLQQIPYSTGGAWHQIDLEDFYSVSKVFLQLGTMPTGAEIEIRASNVESFAEYELLSRIKLNDSKWKVEEGQYAVTVGDPTKYRYIRVVNPTGALNIYQHRVYTDDLGGGSRNALPERIEITDNLMERVVREHWSSAAVHVFSAKYINVSYNEINGCPYTGITLGWNWGGGPDMPGIKINYNRIKDCMQRSHDGAAIYVLGTHTDSEIKGNYITGCVNGMGGIYTDNGSCYWVVEENVIEDVNISLHPWSADQHDLTFRNNYTTEPYYVIGAQNTTMENTELFIRDHMPAHIREKANLAGIREEYKGVYDGVVGGKAPWFPILIDGYPAPQCYGPHYFWNQGFSYLQSIIMEANNVLKTAKMSNLVPGYEEETQLFEDRIYEILEIYNSEFERDRYFTAVSTMDRYIDEFLASGIFDGKEYKATFQNFGIAGESAGAGETVINSEKPISLEMFIDDYDYLTVNGGSTTRNREKNQFSVARTNGGVTYYNANKFGDVVFEGKMKFDYSNELDWQGMLLRASNISGMPGSQGFDCYIVDFQDYSVEVQRFNNGERTVFYGKVGSIVPYVAETLGYGGWKRNELSDIKVTTRNEDGGVRLILEANGVEIFNILDDTEGALTEPGYVGLVSPAGTVEIHKASGESNEYFDLTGYEWAKTPVYQLTYMGAINGTSEGVFSPDANITRAEYSKILAKILGISGSRTAFADVKSGWYFEAVAGLEALGAYSDVYYGSFEADTPITREEMAAIAMKALKGKGKAGTSERGQFTDAAEISPALSDAVLEYAALGLISGMGDGTFAPKKTATRAEAAKLLYSLYSAQEGIK